MKFNYHTQILDNLMSAIVVVQKDMQIIYANHSALTLFNTGRKQLYRYKLGQVVAFTSVNQEKLKTAFTSHEGFSEDDIEVCLYDDRVLRFDLSVNFIDLNGTECLMLEAKHIDQLKRISKDNLQHTQQHAARQLVRGLAHEIKNPLGGIRGAAQLLAMELDTKEHQEYTNMIMSQSDRLRNLVDRLLGPNSLPNLNLDNIHLPIEQVYQLVKNDNPYKIQFVRDYDPSIPELFFDTDMLQQTLLNIVQNAMQALQEAESKLPKIRIKTRIARNEVIRGIKTPLSCVIYIYDNGPGIPNEVKDTLFYPMISSKDTGSGLGLSIAQTLIDHHDGKIDVETRRGRTEFSIYLPIKKSKELT